MEDRIVIPNGAGAIIVQWSEFKGIRGLSIRKYYRDKATDELKPTKKGIWIPEDKAPEVTEVAFHLVWRAPHDERNLCYEHHCQEFDKLPNRQRWQASCWHTVDPQDCEICNA